MSPSSPAGSSTSLPDTNTLLALPDGPIPPNHSDRTSHAISLIGGYPTFPLLPSSSKAPEDIRCGFCHQAIPLLAQVYCPPEGGENDRTVYVWACAKSGCQRREGSVRAFRASVRNKEYMRDVETKRKEVERKAEAEREKAKQNPFSIDSLSQPSSAGLFGGPDTIFGGSSPPQNPPVKQVIPDEPPDVSGLSIASNSTTTFAPPVPAYQPPQYLSTIDEYLPPPEDMEVDDDDEGDEKGQKAEFRDERWEQLLPNHMDAVFERFARRLDSAEGGGHQVLRYELGGAPLPYSSQSSLFKRLFPTAPTTAKSPDQSDDEDLDAFYDPSSIPSCPRCNAKRVFELQLVPALISVLPPSFLSTTGEVVKTKKTKETEEERRKELARLAGGVVEGESGVAEMEWGTVMVFACEKDCEGFGEEWVGVEWETTLSS